MYNGKIMEEKLMDIEVQNCLLLGKETIFQYQRVP